MSDNLTQVRLAPAQVEAFHHDEFVADQVRDFQDLLDVAIEPRKTVVDVGGGCGFFAGQLAALSGLTTRVLDMDPGSIARCRELGVDAVRGDALAPQPCGDESIVCFNLVLHHLVGKSEADTDKLQRQALEAWHGRVERVFVNEYIYESFIRHWSGRLVYEITSSPILSAIGKAISKVVPSFRANTFGVGVRFRSHEQWRGLFARAGYAVKGHRRGVAERVSPPLRLLLIRTIRRDSYLLEPVSR